ncbi:DUF4232 domain-containing protein [Streptomyces sp. NPDC058867]|uniref:DUF4232 domain-containing protein n=1 Tax=unclassified Streptomyces TaxID=2593676 RepID=UPI003686F9AC
MAHRPRSLPRTALSASVLALLGAVTACGGPASDGPASGGTTATTPSPSAPEATAPEPSSSPSAAGAGSGPSRCRTAELRAEVGGVDPGAGQRNFPIVLTNASARTCAVYGYPGAAFVDSDGDRLGTDPVRSPDTPTRVTLEPGDSAWAGLSYSSPEVSGARTARPAALLVTPPDEREPIEVAWKGGAVPVSGTASSVRLTVFAPGSGP